MHVTPPTAQEAHANFLDIKKQMLFP